MELIIRVVEKANGMPVGGVIAAFPDGHDWTERERTNPEWRIIKCNLNEAEVASLLSTAIVKGEFVKRQMYLDSTLIKEIPLEQNKIEILADSVVRDLFVLADPEVVK